MGDGDKFPVEDFGLGRPRFDATNYLKLKLKYFFLKR